MFIRRRGRYSLGGGGGGEVFMRRRGGVHEEG